MNHEGDFDNLQNSPQVKLLQDKTSYKMTETFPLLKNIFGYKPTLKDGIESLSRMILKNHDLTCLDLSKMNIGAEEIHQLADTICECIWIKEINLSENCLKNDVGKIIGWIIKNNDSLTCLRLSHNQLEEIAIQYVGQALRHNTGIEILDLSWNHIRLKGAVTLCNGLLENKYIHTLNISSNGFAYEGAVALSKVFKHNKSLKEIDISDNRICWKSALVLSKGIQVNKTLETIKLRRNPLTTTGCMDILEAISTEGNAVRLLDIQDIAVIFEFELLLGAIKMKRNINCLHGFVVSSHDYLGRRNVGLINPMDVVISFMKRKSIRPIELLSSFDKTNNWTVSKKEFIARLKKSKVPLHDFEMEQVTDDIHSHNPEDDKDITYRKLIRSVSDRIRTVRREKVAEIDRKRKLCLYHKRILNSGKPKHCDIDEPERGFMKKNSSNQNVFPRLVTVPKSELGNRSLKRFSSGNKKEKNF